MLFQDHVYIYFPSATGVRRDHRAESITEASRKEYRNVFLVLRMMG